MVELCITKEHSSFFPTLTLEIFLYFSELKIPKSFISSMETKRIEISSESPFDDDDEMLTVNNIYLKIGYILNLRERIKLVTYNYFKKKMLDNITHVMATLRHDIPKTSYQFQRIRLLDEEIESILKRHIAYLYSLNNVLGDMYIRYVRRYEEIFELNGLLCR